MADKILKNIYLDIYNAPRLSNVTIDNKIKQYRKKLGHGSKSNQKGVILIDPVNLTPIKAVPSVKSKGSYKLFNKLAENEPKVKYFNLFNSIKKEPPKKINAPKKEPAKKGPCPQGSERNPKTGRCKKIIIKKKI